MGSSSCDLGSAREDVERLYSSFAPVVFRLAVRMLGRKDDAWDIVHDAFERMLSRRSSVLGQAKWRAWAYRITTNAARNHLRSRRIREPGDQLEAPEHAVAEERVEARDWLAKWLGCLNERQLTVASLLYIEGLTQIEAAESLGLSRKTIERDVEVLRVKLMALGALPEEDS
jgi:RNA polymerase sigma factor (sigma-70 family)